MADQFNSDDVDACLAGAAALDEVATLRAERAEMTANVMGLSEERDEQAAELMSLRARVQQLEQALREVERNCPCGARPECLDRYPHVISCPVAAALSLLDRP